MTLKESPAAKDLGTINMAAVRRIAEVARIDKIYLLDARINSDPFFRDPRDTNLKYECGTEILPQQDDNSFSILCNFSVAAHHQDTEKLVMSIETSFVTRYLFDSINELKREDLENFAKINPLYNVWPYWREFVQNMTNRMGFPALTIPLLIIEEEKPPSKGKITKTSKKSLSRKNSSKALSNKK